VDSGDGLHGPPPLPLAPASATTALKPTLFDPQLCRKLRIVASDLLDEALRVLAVDEDVERVTGLVGESESSTTA
jgi:hypothetical protein